MRLKIVVADFEVPVPFKKWCVRVGLPIVGVLVAGVALADPVTFSDGQPLRAADLNTNVGYLVPSGAVVAFNLATCPAGWTAFAAAQGRAIIGVNPTASVGLSQRNLGDTVGEETHTMTVAELVAHSHVETVTNTSGYPGTDGLAAGDGYAGANHGGSFTQSAGGGSPFNNMQPSLALLYCQKN